MDGGLIPGAYCNSIFELDLAGLRRRGIRLLLADLDNTLVPYGVKEPSPTLHDWVAATREQGLSLFILSNSRKPHRVKRFSEALAVPFLGHAGKPGRSGFSAAIQRENCQPQEAVMVGDQIFTDIWGGNRSGIWTILVRPLHLDSPFRLLRYAVETPFRRLARETIG